MASAIGGSSQTFGSFLDQSETELAKAKSLLGNTKDKKITDAFSNFHTYLGVIKTHGYNALVAVGNREDVKYINTLVKTVQEAVSSQTLGTTLDQAMTDIANKLEENEENAFKAFYAVSSIRGVCSSELTTSLDKLSQENQKIVEQVNTVAEMILSGKNSNELGVKIDSLGIPGNIIRVVDIQPHYLAASFKSTKAVLTFLGSFPKREEMTATLTLSGKTVSPLASSTLQELKFEVEIKNILARTLEGSLKIDYDLKGPFWPLTWYAKEATFNILLKTNSLGQNR